MNETQSSLSSKIPTNTQIVAWIKITSNSQINVKYAREEAGWRSGPPGRASGSRPESCEFDPSYCHSILSAAISLIFDIHITDMYN